MTQAVEALRQGLAVVFPTDTVYGVGVAVRFATSPQAVYDLKQRDAGKPIAWLVDGPEALDTYGADVPESARKLAAEHWPGALTIIVKASDAVPPAYRSDAGSIGLRAPASSTALDLIAAVGPIATSSANLAGTGAPRAFSDIDREILAGAGACMAADEPLASGTASTVVDCSTGCLQIIRAGEVTVKAE